MYNPYSGVTSNQSESFNALLKRLQSCREVPLDTIVLSLYYLQAYYSNEVQRGFAGLGTFLLSVELEDTRRPADEIFSIPTYQPEEIMSRIQQRNMTMNENVNIPIGTENTPPDENIPSPLSMPVQGISIIKTAYLGLCK